MKLRSEVQWERAKGYLFDRRLGGIFALNPTSTCVLEGLERGLDEDGLVSAVVQRFETGELCAREDVSAFLDVLMENDLVQH